MPTSSKRSSSLGISIKTFKHFLLIRV
jgi:hypothetical protein